MRCRGRPSPETVRLLRGAGVDWDGDAIVRHLSDEVLRMEKERPGLRYLVFTNDKEAAKEALEGEHTERKMTYISELGAFSDIDEFFLMAACRHQIISNSSYSTWAA